MLIALPLIAFVLTFLNVSAWNKTKTFIFREKLLISLILWSIYITLVTEGLSLINGISLFWVSTAWTLILIILLPGVVKNLSGKRIIPRLGFPSLANNFNNVLLGLTVLILIVTFVLAIFVAPNNADAMKTHLARIPQWIQNQNISYYPTHITWQVSLAPWASYPQLHFYLLGGGDYFANLVQWIFAAGSLIGVSLIAKHFRANLQTQLLSVFIAATIPMGILQSSSAQADYILTFFLVTFVYFLMSFISTKNYLFLFIASCSLGLALLTKQLAYIYALPFILWFLWVGQSKFGLKQAFINLVILGSIILIVNFGFFARNYVFAGSPIFSLRDEHINKPIGVDSLVSGTIKNIALHISLPIPHLHSAVYDSVYNIHQTLGIPLDKAGFSWIDENFNIPSFRADENRAPNIIHLILILGSSIWIFYKKKNLRFYFVSLIIGFLLFSLLLRWQIGGSRWHLPLFVLASPIIAVSWGNWKIWIRRLIVIALIVSSFYYLFFNVRKPVIAKESIFSVDRDKQYFFRRLPRQQIYEQYTTIGIMVKNGGYKNVGLIFEENTDDFEYPLWRILLKDTKDLNIRHIDVENQTKYLATPFKPDVVIFIGGKSSVLKKYINQRIPVIGIK